PKKGPIISIPASSPLYHKPQDSIAEGEAQWRDWATPIHYQATDGKLVGSHDGAHYFTIGQRKGMAVGGTAEPLFVLATDTQTNTLFVGEGAHHPGLYRKALRVAKQDVHWVREDLALPEGESMEVQARIRYRQPLEPATLYSTSQGLYVVFDQPQSAITPGQFVAWYRENELLGSGVIA
ncbi:MAG: aminomethyltransferase beta-barrel domain-containing protein, partial [Flavobacteriaceae bacterium]